MLGRSVPDVVDLAVFCRPVRDRLGNRPQIHRWFLEAGPDCPDRGFDDRQPHPARPGAQGAARRTAYAVWTGIGTVGTALLGIWLLGEPATAIRLACIALIVCGIMG